MQRQRIFIATLFIIFCGSSLFALSPEIRFDMLKTKLTQQLKEQQYTQALETMHEIRGLDITVPTSLDYFEGKALFESGKEYEAYEILTNYVETNGKSAKYYRQAISYMVKAEETYTAEKEKREAAARREKEKREAAAREKKEKEMTLRRQIQEFAQRPVYNNKNTGLMWTLPLGKEYLNNPAFQGKVLGTKLEARNYCENLNLAGHSDWRVPTMQEFTTIAGKGNKYSSIDWPTDFHVWLWGSPECSDKDTRYHTDRMYAVMNQYIHSYDDQSAMIMCVRKESPEAFKEYFSREYRVVKFRGHRIMVEDRYMISNQQCYATDPSLTFSTANNYCKELKLGGFDDWRVPTKKDMLERIPCQIAHQLSFLVDGYFYHDLWYGTGGFFGSNGFMIAGNECKLRGVTSSKARHHVRCVRDVD